MGNACTFTPHVKNDNGEIKPSILFKDLKTANADYRMATAQYEVSKQDFFRDGYSQELEFDLNGEPTYKTFKKVIKVAEDKVKLLKSLNKEFLFPAALYSTVMPKVLLFNSDSSFNDSFMATVTMQDDGTYKAEIVERTLENEKALEDVISNEVISKALDKLLLEKLNIGTIFNNTKEFNGRYSTKDAARAADGLYYLVEVSRGHNMATHYAEEVGHAVLASYGDHPLVQRLQEFVKDPEVLRSLLGEEYDTKDLGENPAREVAGDLIGKALYNTLSETAKKSPVKKLLDRIVTFLKKSFYRITGNDIQYIKMQAEQLASAAALNFISADFSGLILNNLSTKETLYSRGRKSSVNRKTMTENINFINDSITSLLETAKAIKDLHLANLDKLAKSFINEDLQEQYMILWDALNGYSDLDKSEQEQLLKEVTSNIVSGVLVLSSQLANMAESNIHKAGGGDLVLTPLNTVEIFKLIRLATIVNDSLHKIKNNFTPLAKDSASTITVVDESSGELVLQKASYVYAKIQEAADSLETAIENIGVEAFSQYCAQIYGRGFVERAKTVVFKRHLSQLEKRAFEERDFSGRNILLKLLKPFAPGVIPERTVSFRQELLRTDDNMTWYRAWFSSMLNSGDLIAELCKMAIDNQNRAALVKFGEDRKFMDSYAKKMLKNTGSMRSDWMIQKENGINTGYFLGPKNISLWKHLLSQYEKELEVLYAEELDSKHSEGYAKKLHDKDYFSYQLGLSAFQQAKVREWHKSHSIYDKETERWTPNNNSEYYVQEWHDLSLALRDLINEYVEYLYKKELETLGPEGAEKYRAPQIYGGFFNRYHNLRGRHTVVGAMVRNIFNSVIHDWNLNSLENTYDYGRLSDGISRSRLGLNDYSIYGGRDPRASWMQKIGDIRTKKALDVPIKGVIMRDKKEEMSTDILYSAADYFYFLNKKKAFSEIMNQMETAKYIVGSKRNSNRLFSGPSYSSKDLLNRGINLHLYNTPSLINWQWSRNDVAFMARQIFASIGSLGSRLALAYNPNPAVVNVLTGANEITKEALSLEFFNTKDLTLAHALYFRSRPSNFMHMLKGEVWNDKYDYAPGDYAEGEILSEELLGNVNMNHINLFLTLMDVLNSTALKITKLKKNLFLKYWDDAAFMMYSTTDHYMQGMPYLAMALHTKLWDTQQKKVVNLILAHTLHFLYDMQGKVVTDVDGKPLLDYYGVSPNRYILLSLEDADRFKHMPTSQIEEEMQATQRRYLELRNRLRGYKDEDVVKLNESLNSIAPLLRSIQEEDETIEDIEERIQSIQTWLEENTSDGTPADNSQLGEELLELLNQRDAMILSEAMDAVGIDKINANEYESIVSVLELAVNSLYWNDTRENRFASQAREVANRLHGIYNSIDASLYMGSAYGKMQTSMKGYAHGMMQRRLLSNYYSLVMDKDMEGSWITSTKMLLDPDTSYLWNLVSRWRLHKDEDIDKLKLLGYNENQIANMFRSKYDFIWAAVLTGLLALILPTVKAAATAVAANTEGAEDDDEEEIFDLAYNPLFHAPKYKKYYALIYGHFLLYRAALEQAVWQPIIFASKGIREFSSITDIVPVAATALINLYKRTSKAWQAFLVYLNLDEMLERPNPFDYIYKYGTSEEEMAKGKEEYTDMKDLWKKDIHALGYKMSTVPEPGELTFGDFLNSPAFRKFIKATPTLFRFPMYLEDPWGNYLSSVYYMEGVRKK